MITLDTSGLFAALNRVDPNHELVQCILLADPGPRLIPDGLLAEVTYLVEARLGHQVLTIFLDAITQGGYQLECSQPDVGRIRVLVERYRDLPLGFADAAVIACAERRGRQVLTLDLKHFGVVAREGTIEILPGWH